MSGAQQVTDAAFEREERDAERRKREIANYYHQRRLQRMARSHS